MEKEMGKFRFKGYEFRFNPSRFQINGSRNLKVFESPLCGAVTQDLGFAPLQVSGEGELLGDDLMGEYQKLYRLFQEKSSGMLFLPDMKPFYCFFEKLSVTGRAGPRVLTYQFSFTEDCEKNSGEMAVSRPYYIAKAGDTLYLIGVKCGVSTARLLEKNPRLSLMSEIKEGTMIWL